MSKRIEDLSPECRVKYQLLADWLTENHIGFTVLFTRRTDAEQVALYAQGRQSLDNVNALMTVAGLPKISDRENVIVTQRDGIHKRSNHQDGKAFDLTFVDSGRAVWPKDSVRWFALGTKAEEFGLTWGGRFTPLDPVSGLGWDVDHFEIA